ncbi:MAG TPA: transcriptional regulator FtrA [Terriglobales bacterium]|nr:transcriptional regulator FtrA [Terriglobales bacterium]
MTTAKLSPRTSAFPAQSFHRNVAVLAYNGQATFELGIVVELFGLPRPEFSEWYRFKVCALETGPLAATGGLTITCRHGIDALSRAGTIVIPGWRTEETPPERLLRILRRAHRGGARLVSICSGAFVLAATGLLDGRRATTHWRYASQLAQMYPRVKVEPDVLYVDEGDLLTSAGSAAGIDLCLHIVRKDFGDSVASQVARRLVVYPHRDGGQAQFVDRAVPREDRPWLAKLLEWTQNHLGEELSVHRLAKEVGISKRTLSRRFAEELATSPIEWLIGLRLAHAKQMLEKTARSIDEIAYDTGFGSAPTLRHHFRRRLNTSPVAYRSHFR